MSDEVRGLADLNVAIGDAEHHGDAAFFDELLAASFSMRRANGTVVDRSTFIAAVRPSAARTTEIHTVSILGPARAVVTCVVGLDVDGRRQRFDNARLFVRPSPAASWQLLAWANEPAAV